MKNLVLVISQVVFILKEITFRLTTGDDQKQRREDFHCSLRTES